MTLEDWKKEQERLGRTFFPLPMPHRDRLRLFGFQANGWLQIFALWAPLGTRCDSLCISGVEQIASGDMPMDALAQYMTNLLPPIQPGGTLAIHVRQP